jgi:hypothetical protein
MKHTGLCLVLLQLFDRIPNKGIWNSIMDYCWKESLDRLNTENQLPNNIQTTNQYAFGILDGNVWKIKVENVISKIDSPLQISDEIFENWYDYHSDNNFNIRKDFEHLNVHLLSPYMDTIRALFKDTSLNSYMNTIRELFKDTSLNYVQKHELELKQWKIKIYNDKIELQVFKDKYYSTCTKIDCDYLNFKKYLIKSSLLDNGDILILTTIGLFIYHFNENNKSITLNYFYHMYLLPMINCNLQLNSYRYIKFSNPTLPLLNYNSFKLNFEWISYLKDNKLCLLKYGIELLSFSIKEHKLELIDDIYKKCIIYFKQDLRSNREFLSIITSTMPLFNEYYPEYILRYSLETAMIIDSSFYSIKHRNINSHLYSFFKYSPIDNSILSILWIRIDIRTIIYTIIFNGANT